MKMKLKLNYSAVHYSIRIQNSNIPHHYSKAFPQNSKNFPRLASSQIDCEWCCKTFGCATLDSCASLGLPVYIGFL